MAVEDDGIIEPEDDETPEGGLDPEFIQFVQGIVHEELKLMVPNMGFLAQPLKKVYSSQPTHFRLRKYTF